MLEWDPEPEHRSSDIISDEEHNPSNDGYRTEFSCDQTCLTSHAVYSRCRTARSSTQQLCGKFVKCLTASCVPIVTMEAPFYVMSGVISGSTPLKSSHPCPTSWSWILSGMVSPSSTKPMSSLSNVAPTTSSATSSSIVPTVTDPETRLRRKRMEYARRLVSFFGLFAKCRYAPRSGHYHIYINIYQRRGRRGSVLDQIFGPSSDLGLGLASDYHGRSIIPSSAAWQEIR